MTEHLHPILHQSFEALSDAGLRWALLRPPRSLERPQGDVDLLVHPADVERASSVLQDRGYVPIAGPGTSRPLLARDEASGDWIHLDLADRLPGLDDAEAAETVLARRRTAGGVPRLDPGDEFWALVLHLAERGSVEERHRTALAATWSAAEPSPLAGRVAATVTDGRGWAREVLTAVAASEWERLDRALGTLSAALGDPGPSHRSNPIARALAAWRHRGVSVALLGPDGAGKSTLADCITRRSFFATRVIYMGTGVPGELSARPVPLRILRGPVLFSIGGILTQWVRYLTGLGERLRGKVVVFDRYTEEAWLPANPGDPAWRRVGRRVRRVLACPPPDVAIVLDVPGEVMFARKGEHDPRHLDAERERYRSLARTLRQAALVDGLQPADEVCAHAMRGIWDAYRRRWSGAAAGEGGR